MSEDLRNFLDLCDFDTNLRIHIEQSCSCLDGFFDKKNNWVTEYQMSRDQFKKCLNMADVYQHALIDWEEYDIIECVEPAEHNVDAFMTFVAIYSDFYKKSKIYNLQHNNNNNGGLNLVYRLAFDIYKRDRKTRPTFTKFTSFYADQIESKNKVNVALATTLGCAAGSLLMLPVGSTIIGGMMGALVDLVASIKLINPYLNEQTARRLLLEEVESLENMNDEQMYEESLGKLNLHKSSSNEAINNVRREYLLAFDPDKTKGNVEVARKLIQLERSYRIVRAYRINMGTWGK
jgi:hypothetical protein